MIKISVVSPSNREDGLNKVADRLREQSFQDFEWLVCSSYEFLGGVNATPTRSFPDPSKRKGDYYNLNKAWNLLFSEAKGELIVSIVDYTEFGPDTLQKLWDRYTQNPISCISGIGEQYDGDNKIWDDPRYQNKKIYPISPLDMEFRVASIPRAAIYAVGGMDEEYDKVVACSEKEICLRMNALGYLFLIDTDVTYKFYKHEPHGGQWNKLYKKSVELLDHHLNEVLAGRRLKLPFVNWP